MVYRADGEGFLPDAFGQVFVVPAEGGTPRQLTEGPCDHDDLAWSADGSEILVSANRHENADLEPNDSDIHAMDVATGAIRALTKRFGPDAQPAASPDGKYIAYTGYDDTLPGLPARAPVRPAPRQRRDPRARRRPRPRHRNARPGAATAGASTSSTTIRARRASPRRTSPAASRTSSTTSAARAGHVPTAAARSPSRATARSPTARTTPSILSEVGVYDGGKSRRLTKLNDGPARAARARPGRGNLEHDRRPTGAACRAG